jgi:hypothetical protein
MTYKTTEEVVSLVKAFEGGTLAKSQWTHSAKLTVGLYYCLRFPFGRALTLMRDGIKKLNLASGFSNSVVEGYHETVNTFWMIVIKQFCETSKCYNLAELANQLTAVYKDEELPLQYYSPQLLTSPAARNHHLSPDLDRFYLFVNSACLISRVHAKVALI